MAFRSKRPTTTIGRTPIFLLWCILWFGIATGLSFTVSKVLGCEVNEAGAGICMLGPIDIMQPLTVLSFAALLGLFALVPSFLVASVIAGVAFLVRGRW